MALLITDSGANDTTSMYWCVFCTPDSEGCTGCEEAPSQLLFPPPPPTHSKISIPLKISLVILVVTFSLFLLYTLFKFYSVWHRMSRRQPQRPVSDPDAENPDDHAFLDQDLGPVVDHPIWYIRTVGLQPSVINSITVIKFKKGEGLVDGTDCSVCLSEFEDDETLRLLPACNHAFHLPCIDTWLSSHTNCPLCRAGIANGSPSSEQVVLDISSSTGSSSGEAQEENSGESGSSELRIRVDEEIDDVFPKSEVPSIELAVVRRSVSLDSSAASRISFAVNAAMAKNSDSGDQSDGTRMAEMEQTDSSVVQRSVDVDQNLLGLAGSSRTLQRGANFMRRSFSCSGKVLPSRHSGREDSVPPS